ncbi:MAG: YceI family protein [Desulfovermiculus sp.]|nr:YceI family protein [Desulfovermiculus sp.]
MKKYVRFLVIALMLIVYHINPSPAQAQEWQIDTNHSNIYFEVRHTFVPVRGLFEDFSGTVDFDAENLKVDSINFQVQVDSINTNITKRDNHLRSDDFFGARNFPQMTFSSSQIRELENGHYVALGQLTMKDVSKEVEVAFDYLGTKDNPLQKGQKVAGFEAEFSINRLDYKVGSGRFARMGVVGEEVHILVALELLKNI